MYTTEEQRRQQDKIRKWSQIWKTTKNGAIGWVTTGMQYQIDQIQSRSIQSTYTIDVWAVNTYIFLRWIRSTIKRFHA